MIGSFKYIGMILDMNFNEHSDYIYKTAMQVQCPVHWSLQVINNLVQTWFKKVKLKLKIR